MGSMLPASNKMAGVHSGTEVGRRGAGACGTHQRQGTAVPTPRAETAPCSSRVHSPGCPPTPPSVLFSSAFSCVPSSSISSSGRTSWLSVSLPKMSDAEHAQPAERLLSAELCSRLCLAPWRAKAMDHLTAGKADCELARRKGGMQQRVLCSASDFFPGRGRTSHRQRRGGQEGRSYGEGEEGEGCEEGGGGLTPQACSLFA